MAVGRVGARENYGERASLLGRRKRAMLYGDLHAVIGIYLSWEKEKNISHERSIVCFFVQRKTNGRH